MDSYSAYKYIVKLKEHSFLRDFNIEYNPEAFGNAISVFKEDFKRWYNEPISLERLSITPQLQTVLLYRIAHEFYLNHTQSPVAKDITPPPTHTRVLLQ